MIPNVSQRVYCSKTKVQRSSFHLKASKLGRLRIFFLGENISNDFPGYTKDAAETSKPILSEKAPFKKTFFSDRQYNRGIFSRAEKQAQKTMLTR